MVENVISWIKKNKNLLPNKQRVLCDFILENQLLVGTLTVSELASQAHVAATTVLRFVEKLGYNNYSQFRRDLFESAMQLQNDTYASLQRSFSGNSTVDLLSSLCTEVTNHCQKIANQKNIEQFNQSIQTLLNAKRIYVLGLRSAASISMYLENAIRLFMDNTVLLSLQQEYLFDRVLEMTPDDALFLISTWPCTKKTVDFAKLCHDKNVPVILITNTSVNPVTQYGTYIIDTETVSTAGEHIASLIVCQAYIEELGRKVYPHSSQKLSELNDFFKENNVIIWDVNQ